MFFSWLLTVLLVVVTAGYLYLKWKTDFWTKRGIPFEAPHLIYGNLKNIHRKHSMGMIFTKFYENYGHNKVFGMFLLVKPALVICDLDLVKTVLIKDFQKLSDRVNIGSNKDDPLNANIVALPFARWKTLRAKLTPSFSSGKIKAMLPIISQLADKLLQKLGETDGSNDGVDSGDFFSRFTTDVIGNCAFGLDCNSLDDPESEFLKYGNAIFHPKPQRRFVRLFMLIFGRWAKKLGVKTAISEVHNFFYNVAKETVDYREQNSTIPREDFLHSMLQMKTKGEMSFDEIAAQMFVFQLAGYETSSITLTYLAYELTKNPDIQERLREEVQNVIEEHAGEINYETVSGMPLMEMVIKETLRKYPPATFVMRKVVVDDYVLPEVNLKMKRDDILIIPIYGIQKNPAYYPSPEEFIPERFLPENVKSRSSLSFLAFGEGPKICLGMRFAEMELKIVLTKLLMKFRMEKGKDFEEEMEFKTSGLLLAPKNPVNIRFVKL